MKPIKHQHRRLLAFGVFIVIWSMMYNVHTYIHKYIHAVHPTEPKSLLMLMEAAEGFLLSIEVQTTVEHYSNAC